jgi:NADPH-dependent F420 reductase
VGRAYTLTEPVVLFRRKTQLLKELEEMIRYHQNIFSGREPMRASISDYYAPIEQNQVLRCFLAGATDDEIVHAIEKGRKKTDQDYAEFFTRVIQRREIKKPFMKIGIIGGTGNMGKGLAIRWLLKHDILIGSRSLEKARRIAKELEIIARGFYQREVQGNIEGVLNSTAANESEVLVISLPSEAIIPTMTKLKPYLHPKQTIVSNVVAMTKKKGLFCYTRARFCYKPLSGEETDQYSGKSAAEVIQQIVEPTPVVCAFQTVPAGYLNNIDNVMNIDVLIASNHDSAVAVVSKLIRDIPNLRPLNVGPLENSRFIESLTPLLLNAAILNNLKEPSIRVVPWMPI